MGKPLKISEEAAVQMPMKTVASLICMVAIGTWAYFGVIETLNKHSTQLELFQKDLEQKESRLTVYKEERQALVQKIQDSQQMVFDLRSAKEQAANQTHMAEIRITSMKERIDQAQEEIHSFESQIEEMQNSVNQKDMEC